MVQMIRMTPLMSYSAVSGYLLEAEKGCPLLNLSALCAQEQQMPFYSQNNWKLGYTISKGLDKFFLMVQGIFSDYVRTMIG